MTRKRKKIFKTSKLKKIRKKCIYAYRRYFHIRRGVCCLHIYVYLELTGQVSILGTFSFTFILIVLSLPFLMISCLSVYDRPIFKLNYV
jgi:hypothetical protein